MQCNSRQHCPSLVTINNKLWDWVGRGGEGRSPWLTPVSPIHAHLHLFCIQKSWWKKACTLFSQETNGKPPLMVTSLQWPLLFCPGGQSTHWPLYNTLCNGNGHYSKSNTAKITSRQWPVFSATYTRRHKWSWNLTTRFEIWDDHGINFDCAPFNNAAV